MVWEAEPVIFNKAKQEKTASKNVENTVDKTAIYEKKTTDSEAPKKISKAAVSRSQAMNKKRVNEVKKKRMISDRELMRMDKERAEKEYLRDLYRDGTDEIITGKIDVTLFNHVIDVIVKDLGFHPEKITNRTVMEFCAGIVCGSAELVEDPYAKVYVERYLAKQDDMYKDKYQTIVDKLDAISQKEDKIYDGVANLVFNDGLMTHLMVATFPGDTLQKKMQHPRINPTDLRDIDYIIAEMRRMGEEAVTEWKQQKGRSIHGMLDKFTDR